MMSNHANRSVNPKTINHFPLSNRALDLEGRKNFAWKWHLSLQSEESFNFYRITRNNYAQCVQMESQAFAV